MQFRTLPAENPQTKWNLGPCSLCTMALMAVTVEMQNTGDSGSRTEIVAVIEHVLSERPGNWHVSIVGSRESKDWELKIEGPNGFQRLYTCGPDQHEPEVIRQLVSKLLPATLL